MLYVAESSDAEIVRAWIARALKTGEIRGQDKKGLAKHCGVSVQAVDGWLATGRITKSNLEKASGYFGHAPSFTTGGVHARQPLPTTPTHEAWPFLRFSAKEIRDLDPKHRARIDKLVRERLDEIAEDSATTRPHAKRRRA